MNTQRVLVLGVAALAAGAAALLARGLLGGGTEKVKAAVPLPRPATTEVLVASIDLQPGTALLPTSVRWQAWPKSSVNSSFISQAVASDPSPIVHGAVTRAPLVAGEPLTPSMMVHADSAGFMAAMVDPGMRAVSVAITTETGAGGFILPNDRVDVIITRQISDVPKRFGVPHNSDQRSRARGRPDLQGSQRSESRTRQDRYPGAVAVRCRTARSIRSSRHRVSGVESPRRWRHATDAGRVDCNTHCRAARFGRSAAAGDF